MYHISLLKDKFILQIGGDIRTLSEALTQIKSLVDNGAEELSDYEGCRWEGFTYMVFDRLGCPIRVVALGEKEE